MAISILSKPYGSTFKVNPVYNGLPFVVSSNKAKRTNFRYICDIYDGLTRVARLKHNPDLGTYYGIFDIGKVYENVFPYESSHLFSLGTGYFNALPNLTRNYYCSFGEEYSRRYKFTQVGSNGGKARFYTDQAHNLRVGDRVYLEVGLGTHSQYNGYSTITQATTTIFTTDINYVGNGDTGWFTEGEAFFDNYFWSDLDGTGRAGFIIPTSRPTRILVGDPVFIKQDTGATNIGYDGTWLVKGIQTITLSGVQYNLIKTDAPWLGSSPADGGVMIAQSNYLFNDLTKTNTDDAWAFNGVLSYRDFPTWNQSDYVLDGTTKKFLTNSPRTLNVRSTDYRTLSLFAKNTSVPFSHMNYTWYVDTLTHTGTSTTDGIILVGNFTTTYRVGDICNVLGFRTILSVTFDGTNTTIIFTTTTLLVTSISLYSRTHRQSYPAGSFWAKQKRVDLQVGLALQASTNPFYPTQTVNRYTIQASATDLSLKSELFTYIVADSCESWPTFQFVWLNPLGGWDWFEFKGRGLQSTSIKRVEYVRRQEALIGTQWKYSVGDRGTRTYGVNANDSVLANSGYVNYETSAWLVELFTSPECFLVEGTQLIPINVTNETVVNPSINKLGARNIQMSFKYSFDRNIQRG